MPKGNLAPEMVRRLQTPNPLTLLEKSLRDSVYRLAYPSFVYDGVFTSTVFTSSPEFTTIDDLTIQYFVNSIVASLASIDLGVEIDPEDAISWLNDNPNFSPDLAININSPGDITIYSQRIVPLVIGALMALALSTPADSAERPVRVINSTSPAAAECTAEIDARVKDAIRLMGFNRWKKRCAELQATAKRTGLKPQATIKR